MESSCASLIVENREIDVNAAHSAVVSRNELQPIAWKCGRDGDDPIAATRRRRPDRHRDGKRRSQRRDAEEALQRVIELLFRRTAAVARPIAERVPPGSLQVHGETVILVVLRTIERIAERVEVAGAAIEGLE